MNVPGLVYQTHFHGFVFKMPKSILRSHLSIQGYCPFACIENLSSLSALPLNQSLMGLGLIPFPEP